MDQKKPQENVAALKAKNAALEAALDEASRRQGGNMPPTEYPSLPQNTRFPSRANFPDDPADKVAAQNVGLQAAQAPQPPRPPIAAPPAPAPQAMQPNPQQQNFAQSQNPAFNVNRGMPDMSALDEAYRRQSQGG